MFYLKKYSCLPPFSISLSLRILMFKKNWRDSTQALQRLACFYPIPSLQASSTSELAPDSHPMVLLPAALINGIVFLSLVYSITTTWYFLLNPKLWSFRSVPKQRKPCLWCPRHLFRTTLKQQNRVRQTQAAQEQTSALCGRKESVFTLQSLPGGCSIPCAKPSITSTGYPQGRTNTAYQLSFSPSS